MEYRTTGIVFPITTLSPLKSYSLTPSSVVANSITTY